jgi:hypothetical protein
MKNFKGLRQCALGAIINTEDFMSSNAAPGSILGGPGDKKKRRFKQSKKARRNTPCRGSKCYKPNTH